MSHLSPVSSTPVPLAAILKRTSISGTRLIQTAIFTRRTSLVKDFTRKGRRVPGPSPAVSAIAGAHLEAAVQHAVRVSGRPCRILAGPGHRPPRRHESVKACADPDGILPDERNTIDAALGA